MIRNEDDSSVSRRKELVSMELVSIEKVQEFQANGAVKLENVFDPHWVDLVRKGVDVNLESPSQYGENLKVLPFLF